MKSGLVVSEDHEVLKKILEAFPPGYRAEKVSDKQNALEVLQKNRYDIVFIDLTILLQSAREKDYTACLQPFKQLYPSIEIIVMSRQDMIRKAVRIVRAGASDYLTYPIDPEEVKLVVETIHESIIKQSELDYLRDQVGISDALEIALSLDI